MEEKPRRNTSASLLLPVDWHEKQKVATSGSGIGYPPKWLRTSAAVANTSSASLPTTSRVFANQCNPHPAFADRSSGPFSSPGPCPRPTAPLLGLPSHLDIPQVVDLSCVPSAGQGGLELPLTPSCCSKQFHFRKFFVGPVSLLSKAFLAVSVTAIFIRAPGWPQCPCHV